MVKLVSFTGLQYIVSDEKKKKLGSFIRLPLLLVMCTVKQFYWTTVYC